MSRTSALALLLLAGGCDSTFEPLEESAWVYSIAGHLEPSADTQWVRVNALRPVIGTSDDPIDAVVTLEELESGRSFTLNPVLATYRPILEGGDTQYAFNFWTAEPIRPGFTYRLLATRSDGASSSATVAIPDDDFTVTYARWVGDARPYLDEVRVEGVPDLAMVLLRYRTADNCAIPSFADYQKLDEDPTPGEGPHISLLDWDTRPSFLPAIPNCAIVDERIVVVASGDPWPFVAATALRDLMHPNMVGNVDNGTGYLAGLLQRSYPRESCFLSAPLQQFCEVTFSSTSASLEGTVLGACVTGPLQGAEIRLEEVTGIRIRRTFSDIEGKFRIEGLEPGMPYHFTVSHSSYLPFEDPALTLSASEDRLAGPIHLDYEGGSGC